MVVRIKTGKSIRKALSYNERKLKADKADLLLAGNYPVDERLMGFTTKLAVFQALMDQNPKIETNAVHISVNFPPEERLTDEKLSAIAMEYMEQIGFASQPFLVYRHRDANHPHIHIVTTNLRRSGKPLNLHNLAKEKSEPARKLLEGQFELIQAESRTRQHWKADDIAPWPAEYGKEETKHAITNIVGKVLSSYKFENFEQLNAILSQFRIMAYRGRTGSRMHNANGLVYQLLDREGNRVGVPIKASSIDQSPTLKNLQKWFARGQVGKIAARKGARNVVLSCLKRRRAGESVKELLEKKDLGLVIEHSTSGEMSSGYVVDHRRRAVFSADELGIQAVELARITATPSEMAEPTQKSNTGQGTAVGQSLQSLAIPAATLALVNTLLGGEASDFGMPDDEGIKKRKKRRKGPSL